MIGTQQEVLGAIVGVFSEQFALLVMDLHREGAIDGRAVIERMNWPDKDANRAEVRDALRAMIEKAVNAVDGGPPPPTLRLVD